MPRKIVRARDAYMVRDPDSGEMTNIDPTQTYDESSSLVKAHRWAFASDDDVVVEQATAEPGEKRTVKRPT